MSQKIIDKALCSDMLGPIDLGSNVMANPAYEFDPVTISRRGAWVPGQRVFYIQAERGLDRVTLLCEKEQVQALAKPSTKWRASSRGSSSWRAFLPWRWMK